MKLVVQSIFHIIISSNGERKFLTRVNQDILYNYIQAMLYNKHCIPIVVNGYGNHVHIVVDIVSEVTVQRLVKEIQINTTDFIRREKSVFPEFYGWGLNYVAISLMILKNW